MSNTQSNHTNLYQNTIGSIASVGIEKMGSSAVSNLITPAIWTINYAKNGAKPNSVDGGIYVTGLINPPAGIIAGTLKAYMDDDIAKKTRNIALAEPAQYRNFIRPIQDYSGQPPFIAAMLVAQNGGTAWQGKNGQWVYITDARGALVIDYTPLHSIKILRPIFPIVKESNGKFRFGSVNGNEK